MSHQILIRIQKIQKMRSQEGKLVEHTRETLLTKLRKHKYIGDKNCVVVVHYIVNEVT